MKTINSTDYTDRTDVNELISLFEQGCIRNPQTGETLFPAEPYSEEEQEEITTENTTSQIITFNEVKEALEEAGAGYFSFIGSSLEKEIEALNNEYLTYHIQGLNMYNGYFITY